MSLILTPEITFSVKGQPVEEINLGIVPAGSTKTIYVDVSNSGVELSELVVKVDAPYVTVVSHPEILGSGIIVLSYSPPVTVDKGFVTKISISGSYVV